jgi:peroxiredoxin
VTEGSTSGEPLVASSGWGVLHLFVHAGSDLELPYLLAAEETARKQGNQVVATSILGHKADMGIMVLGPDLTQLREFQSGMVAGGLRPAFSYVSLTEVSEYAAGIPDEMRQARLFPQLPPENKRAFCFYPMSKRRGEQDNWYSLDFDARRELMGGHGKVGRTFHGRVLQVITASTGLDDWEWGVSLFATHPDDLKDCVYQMRFDEASARYAEFGPFYAGIVGDFGEILATLPTNRP